MERRGIKYTLLIIPPIFATAVNSHPSLLAYCCWRRKQVLYPVLFSLHGSGGYHKVTLGCVWGLSLTTRPPMRICVYTEKTSLTWGSGVATWCRGSWCHSLRFCQALLRHDHSFKSVKFFQFALSVKKQTTPKTNTCFGPSFPIFGPYACA